MGDDPNQRGNSRRWIMRAVEDSLRRLRHRPDRPLPGAPARPAHRRRRDARRARPTSSTQGKVRCIGTSTFPAEQIVEAQWAAERAAANASSTEQPPYSIFARGVEAARAAHVPRYGLGVLVWRPLNGGWLTGKYRAAAAGRRPAPSAAPTTSTSAAPPPASASSPVEELATLADEGGLALTELALGFVLATRRSPAPSSGRAPSTQLEPTASPGSGRLTADVLDRIDALVRPGHDVNPADAGYQVPALTDPSLRRRP